MNNSMTLCTGTLLAAMMTLALTMPACDVNSADVDTAGLDTADVDPADVDPADVDSADVDSTGVDTAGVNTGGSVEKAIITCIDPALCCTRDQQRTIGSDEDQAQLFLDTIGVDRDALLASPPGSTAKQRLQVAFGTTADEDLAFVFDTYQLISQNLANTKYFCVPELDECSGGALAVNQSPQDNVVDLCPVYFTESSVIRAQTLIHESSHQGRNTPDGLGTDDLAGPSIFNSFSYERYAPVCASAAGCF